MKQSTCFKKRSPYVAYHLFTLVGDVVRTKLQDKKHNKSNRLFLYPWKMENICAQHHNPIPGADCGSDNELLMMSMRLKIKKTKAAKHPIRYDMIHIPEQFNVDIKNSCAELIPIVDEMTPNEL